MPRSFNRFLLLLAIIVTMLIVSGCGADTYIITDLDNDGSGQRVLKFEINKSDLVSVQGGEEALTRTLTEAKPPMMEMKKSDTEEKLVYEFTVV